MLNLQSVMINSEQPEELAAFYTKLFGKPMWGDGGFTGWQVGGAGLMVGPHSEITGKTKEPARIMFGLISDDVESEFERMSGLGAVTVAKPYHPGEGNDGWLATLADPDGNFFQLMSPWPGMDEK